MTLLPIINHRSKLLFIICVIFNLIFFIVILAIFHYFLQASNQPIDYSFHQHSSLQQRNTKQYTLPYTDISDVTSNDTIQTSLFFSYPNNSRGIVECNNFESEIRCDELFQAMKLINQSFYSKHYLLVELPTDKKSAIESLHFHFVLSITSKRRLIVVKSPFNLPRQFTKKPKKIDQNNFTLFKSSQFGHCDLGLLLESQAKGVCLTGTWSILDLLLSPGVFQFIPSVFTTHGMFLLTRLMNFTRNLDFPTSQLQIGVVLEFLPDDVQLLQVLNHLTEGYSDSCIHLYSPNLIYTFKFIQKVKTVKKVKFTLSIIKKLDGDAFNLLVQCDKFVGSLGYFTSHIMNQVRGRGGIWLDQRNTMIVETSSSQSGYLFLLGKTNPNNLMCPGGADAFQHFLLFNAM